MSVLASQIASIQTACFNRFFRRTSNHQMETFSALLALCAGNSPTTGEFSSQRPVTRSFDVFFDLRLNKRLSKRSWGWWFEMPSCPLWRHGDVSENIKAPLRGEPPVTGGFPSQKAIPSLTWIQGLASAASQGGMSSRSLNIRALCAGRPGLWGDDAQKSSGTQVTLPVRSTSHSIITWLQGLI